MFGSISNKLQNCPAAQAEVAAMESARELVLQESSVGVIQSASNVLDDSPSCPDFFEGSEKLLELWFSIPSPSNADSQSQNGRGLRNIPRFELDRMLELVNATIVSSLSSEHWDSYVLSESSLFIADDRMIIKTCGNTTLLLGLQYIIEIAFKYAQATALKNLFYSRKSFLKPEFQKYPHQNFESENEFLKSLFPSGQKIEFDMKFDDKWYVFVYENMFNESDGSVYNDRNSAKNADFPQISFSTHNYRNSAGSILVNQENRNLSERISLESLENSISSSKNTLNMTSEMDNANDKNCLSNREKNKESEKTFLVDDYIHGKHRTTTSVTNFCDKKFHHLTVDLKMNSGKNKNSKKCASEDDEFDYPHFGCGVRSSDYYRQSNDQMNSIDFNSEVYNDQSDSPKIYNDKNMCDNDSVEMYSNHQDDSVKDCSDNNDDDDFTVELLMNKLHPLQSSLFYKGPNYLGHHMTQQTGINTLMEDAVYDSTEFDPCGYSMNSLLNDKYQTIHVTPQDSFSYASYETNQKPADSIQSCYKAITQTFCPETFLLTAFITKNEEQLDQLEQMLDGQYKKVCHQVQNLKRHSVHCIQYIKE